MFSYILKRFDIQISNAIVLLGGDQFLENTNQFLLCWGYPKLSHTFTIARVIL
jgi:hypothetical protein